MTDETDLSYDVYKSNENFLLNDFLNKYVDTTRTPDTEDFIPQEYEVQLAAELKTSNKIIFLPSEQSKAYVATFVIKNFTYETENSEHKRIFYIVDSVENIEHIVKHIRRHIHLNVTFVHDVSDNSSWKKATENAQIVVLSCDSYMYALIHMLTKPSDANLLIFDDCIYCYGGHPMKQIMNIFQNVFSWPKILALTSYLIHQDVKVKEIHEYLKQIEVTFRSSIVTSQYCNAIKKYLKVGKIKYVKFQVFKQPQSHLKDVLDSIFGGMSELITIYSSANQLICNESLRKDLKNILFRISYSFDYYGIYPAYVVASFYKIKLEKLKLLCTNELSSIPLTTIISDFNVFMSLIYGHIKRFGSPEDSRTIVKGCANKIVKLVSFLYKIDYEDTCVVFVKEYFVASMLTYVLQKLRSVEQTMSHILADFVGDDDLLLGMMTDREKCFKKKIVKIILKKFRNHTINTLVVPWSSKIEHDDINADFLIYFDTPPDLTSYVSSNKYSNFDNQKKIFFLEEYPVGEAGSECDVDSLEQYVDLDITLKEILKKKDINCEDQFVARLRRTQQLQDDVKENYTPLVTNEAVVVNILTAISVVNRYCEMLPRDAFCKTAPCWNMFMKDDGVVCELQLPIQSGIKTSIECAPTLDIRNVKKCTALKAVKLLYKLGHLDDNLMPTCREPNNAACTVTADECKKIIDAAFAEDYRHISNSAAEKSGAVNCKNNENNFVEKMDVEFNSVLCDPKSKKNEPKFDASLCSVVPFKFAKWLYNCCPQPGVECYLHVIRLKPAYRVPKADRKSYFHGLMCSKDEFGILTSKKLPKVCQFPVYSDLGQIYVNIDVNFSVLTLTDEQIGKTINFHRFLFLDTLQVVKGFLICDYTNRENSYCIVPLSSGEEGELNIAWDVVYNRCVKFEIVEPSDDLRIHTNYYGKNYLGSVITPWYRALQSASQHYIVTNVLSELTPNSPFNPPDQPGYSMTFSEYYYEKYGLEVKQPLQQLLDARAITGNLNCSRPRAQKPGVLRRRGERESDFPETLIPEFCVLQPFPAVYWYKSITLLTITHRLHFALIAEALRQRVASETLLSDQSSSTRDDDDEDEDVDVLVADEDCIQEIEDTSKSVVPISLILKDVKVAKRKRRYEWDAEQLPLDVDRNVDQICSLELMVYLDFMRNETQFSSVATNYTLNETASRRKMKACSKCNTSSTSLWRTTESGETVCNACELYYELHGAYRTVIMEADCTQNLPMPGNKLRLKFLDRKRGLWPGPKQRDILQAFTVAHCQDIVNLERFKKIGSAFIKFATSLWLYKLYPGLNVSQLNSLRKKLIGKRSLCYYGTKLELGSYVKLQDFSTNNDWHMGGFRIPDVLVNIWNMLPIRPEAIFNLDIPRSEQISGSISPETRNQMHEKMLNYFNETVKPNEFQPTENNNHALIYFKKQSVPNGVVADVLKALSGVYVINCGLEAGFKFLQYVGILKCDDLRVHDDACNLTTAAANITENYFCGYEKLVGTLRYVFKNKRLLVESFTHCTCRFSDTNFKCNQNLTFLGDAILDFLINGFIYEYCGDLKISEVEDLRIALVNDVLYAMLSVRLGLHKFLRVDSTSLMTKIDKFVEEQEKVNHEIDHNELLFLIEETNSVIVDSIDVPKALSDIFKALAAAVFLDCGGDLKIVWNVFYEIMKNEVEKFSKKVPKNPVELLYETDLQIEYEKAVPFHEDTNTVIVQMNVSIEHGNEHVSETFFGVGSTTNQAKQIAAKIALKRMSKKFVL